MYKIKFLICKEREISNIIEEKQETNKKRGLLSDIVSIPVNNEPRLKTSRSV